MSILDLVPIDRQGRCRHRRVLRTGVSFAQAFAEAGADLVLGARRVERMAQTAALVEAAGDGCTPG